MNHALSYRPAIDGLRSFAVLSVLAFHLDHAWLRGGFVGVDVFFVISGYLVSSILLFELRDDQLRIGRFYQRRIARLMPAFFAVAFATVCGAALVYLRQDFASVGANLAAAALCVANLKIMLQGNYFELSPDAQPLLHYWSLAVEEQFYLVFPWLLWAIRHTRNGVRLAILGSLAVLSFALCLVLTWRQPEQAFYLLPTRAWELLAGALLANASARGLGHSFRASAVIHQGLAGLGLVLIVASFFVANEAAGFPGYQALFPVLGTVLVLSPVGDRGAHFVERLLSSRPLVFIGKRSYSLYLWHWPVFSLVDYALFTWSTPSRTALKLALTALLTLLCFRFLESPARVYLNEPSRRRITFALLAACVALSVCAGFVIRRSNYVEAAGEALALHAGGRAGRVMLMGDSNASMYGTALLELAEQRDWSLIVISADAGDPLPGAQDGGALWRSSLAHVQATKPELLVLVCAWQAKLAGSPERLAEAVRQLRPHVGRLILITQPPARPHDASRAALRRGARGPFFELPPSATVRRASNAAVHSLEGDGVTVIDVEDLFVDDGEIKPFDSKGRELYQDDSHLSYYGAALVIERLSATSF